MTAPTPDAATTGFDTRQIHAGASPDRSHGSRIPPIHLTAGYVFDSHEQAHARFTGDDAGYSYSRLGNPTVGVVEERLAALEGGTDAILLASGAAATNVALLALLGAGDHFLSSRALYQGTANLFTENFARLGIEVEFVDDPADADDWARRIRPTTRLLFVEPIPNPTNDLVDLELVAGVAHRHGLPFVVDNTLATPYLLRPLEWGADVVIHSSSKFLTGQGAALSGVVVSGESFDWAADPALFPHLNAPSAALHGKSFTQVHGRRAFSAYARDVITARTGATVSPFNAFLLRQGLETLSLRMRQHSRNALTVAQWLEARPEVLSVDHPGLTSNAFHALSRKYLPVGQGSVFTVTVAGGEAGAAAIIDALQVFSHMTHIGDVRSLVLHPASTTHWLLDDAERARLGIHPGTIRLSVGTEDVEDLLDDLQQAFDSVELLAGRAPVSQGVVVEQAVGAVGADDFADFVDVAAP